MNYEQQLVVDHEAGVFHLNLKGLTHLELRKDNALKMNILTAKYKEGKERRFFLPLDTK